MAEEPPASPPQPSSITLYPRAWEAKYIKLNVGGCLFQTTLDTLSKQGEHMLSVMFSGRMQVKTDEDGWVFIDRDGKNFSYILNFLRDGEEVLPAGETERRVILAESRYFAVEGLSRQIEASFERPLFPLTRFSLPVILTEDEDNALINSTKLDKPVVKFVYSRHNNKFSYTTASDDALLRNIELFDKLSMKFSERVLYAKDVSSKTDHICTWFFFGHGKLLAEISCASIVYSSERKLTKIDFPEARLYEENMNLLLYDKPSSPVERPGSPSQGLPYTRRLTTRAASPSS
eukprot:m.191337 g.191337  ORF g.191337 m.191337 type:complete len:290 (+) comp53638_c0_seq1:132-1001(+)